MSLTFTLDATARAFCCTNTDIRETAQLKKIYK